MLVGHPLEDLQLITERRLFGLQPAAGPVQLPGQPPNSREHPVTAVGDDQETGEGENDGRHDPGHASTVADDVQADRFNPSEPKFNPSELKFTR